MFDQHFKADWDVDVWESLPGKWGIENNNLKNTIQKRKSTKCSSLHL